ncbi:glycosyltransferase [Hyphomicrobium sp. MC8b]|uniref:glycosyltransferase n=1 Tax=Hyphomicrobium sp. MC8b TaxID=300273 RepID=UPI0039187BE3
MKVSLVTGSLSRFGGGVSASVQALSRSLIAANGDVSVLGLRDSGWATDASGWGDIPTACLDVVGPSSIGYSLQAFSRLRDMNADIVHSHGLWKHPSRVVLQWASETRRPYVVSPHGMLDAWALKRSVLKKKIAARLYENAHLRHASCLHALCDAEADAIRELGFANPICIIPNGIAMPGMDDSRAAPWANIISSDQRVLLFIGRLHPKKNLPALIEAWPSSAETLEWHLVIAGWDQSGHEDALRALVTKRNLCCRIHFLGPLFGPKKDSALRRADAFVLPSLSEGLPMAILEAWSYGKPVLQTAACNLPDGFRHNAAIRISPTVPQLAEELRAVLQMPAATLTEIGRNGRQLAERNFSWTGVAKQMLEVYAWLRDGGRRPACVRFIGGNETHAA